MRTLGVIAGTVLVVIGSVLFVRAVMPDLWLQLTQEMPKRLAYVIQAGPVAEQPQAEPPLKSPLLARPGAGSPTPPTLPTRSPGGGDGPDGQTGETEPDGLAQRIVAAAEEPPNAVEPAGIEASGAATLDSLKLQEDMDAAAGRASREASPEPEAVGLGDASSAVSTAGPQARGGNEPTDAASTPTAWHAFWKPFRTEPSAIGFATHISQATGLPIEIRRTPRGEYAVGFSYGDKTELEGNVALIEARTGLRVLAEAYQ